MLRFLALALALLVAPTAAFMHPTSVLTSAHSSSLRSITMEDRAKYAPRGTGAEHAAACKAAYDVNKVRNLLC